MTPAAPPPSAAPPARLTDPARAAADPGALRADCARCAALCCVASAYTASSDFAIHKPPGVPCPNLSDACRCTIHARLRESGFPGCVAFDCFGAGQRVTQARPDWRAHPAQARETFAIFLAMRHLHELVWCVARALAWPTSAALHGDLYDALTRLDALTQAPPEALLQHAPLPLTQSIDALLQRASAAARAARLGEDRTAAELIGADLRGRDLRGACLARALALGADLRRADLRGADLRWVDLRGADLRGADLRGALWLTHAQLARTEGDARTRVSPDVPRPAHWPTPRAA